jgi:hypothetical protein
MAFTPKHWTIAACLFLGRYAGLTVYGKMRAEANTKTGPCDRERPHAWFGCHPIFCMIRKLKSGEYRLYSRKKNPKTGKRRSLGTFSSMEKAKAHERAVQYFKRH